MTTADIAAAFQVSAETIWRSIPAAAWGNQGSEADHAFDAVLDYLEGYNPDITRQSLWPSGGKYWTEEEATIRTGLTKNTFRMLGTRGRGPVHINVYGELRYRPEDVERWLQGGDQK